VVTEYLARVYTLAGPAQASITVEDGRVRHIGTPVHGVPRTVVDLEGATILPAFVDSHGHPMALGMQLINLTITHPAVASLAELLEAVARQHRALPPGRWLLGHGYDEGKWPERRPPTREELDRAAPGRAVFLTRACGHHAVASGEAFRQADLWSDRSDVPGVDRDASGAPLGGLHEMAALSRMSRAVPAPDSAERLRACEAAGQTLAAHGIVHASELSAGLEAYREWEVYLEAARAGRLRVGIDVFVEAETALSRGLPAVPALPRRADVGSSPAAPLITLAGLKCFADGSVSGGTAAVSEPFVRGGTGTLTLEPHTFARAAALCRKEGLQLAVHAMGDRAIDTVLDLVESLGADRPLRGTANEPGITLEHATLPSPAAIARIARLGIGVSTQPIFPYAEIASYLAQLGPERTRRAYPLATLLASGVELALSSDAPSTASDDPANPWLGIGFAVARVASQGFVAAPEERLGLTEALALSTQGGSDLRGLGRAGRLAEGYRADMSVWANDPYEVGPPAMAKTHALATLRAGVWIHGDPGTWRTVHRA